MKTMNLLFNPMSNLYSGLNALIGHTSFEDRFMGVRKLTIVQTQKESSEICQKKLLFDISWILYVGRLES